MAEKACHAFASTTQVGLTQALEGGMKNTVAHSLVIIIIGALALVVLQRVIYPLGHFLADFTSNEEATLALFAAPLVAVARLLPGLAIGWFTRRHPLLVGGIAGALSAILVRYLTPLQLEPYSWAGEIIATSMTVAVAALAGRALRHRFPPSNNSVRSFPSTTGA